MAKTKNDHHYQLPDPKLSAAENLSETSLFPALAHSPSSPLPAASLDPFIPPEPACILQGGLGAKSWGPERSESSMILQF